MQALFCARSSRAVGGLGENFGIDSIAVLKRDLIFQSSGYQDIARDIPNAVRARKCLCVLEILDGAGFSSKLIQLFDGNAFGVVKCCIPFGDADDLASIFLGKKLRSVIADVAKSLENDSLAFKASR